MFQFRRFPSYPYLIQGRILEYCSSGFPHSEIPGSKSVCDSPRLIAAYRVLLRLLMPRHPPCALISLNSLFAELCLDSQLKDFSLGEVEIVFTHIFQYWIFIISSLLFRYSIFKDLSSTRRHLKSLDDVYGGLKWTRTIDLSVISRVL